MKIRMVAMDMDGTLLLPDGTISPRAARALVACEERGIRVILASGRSFFNIRTYYKQLGLKSPMLTERHAGRRFVHGPAALRFVPASGSDARGSGDFARGKDALGRGHARGYV